jgi:Cu/Zn superoxide dismutase
MKSIPALLTAVALAAISFTGVAAQPAPVTIQMHALNGSGEDGTATLTQVADGVRVVVDLRHAPDDAQPTHIHLGTCGNINKAPEYGLNLTMDGHAESTVRGVTLDDLKKQPYAINVHKSASDLGTYVSCGDIR